jgi:hypothetical protein
MAGGFAAKDAESLVSSAVVMPAVPAGSGDDRREARVVGAMEFLGRLGYSARLVRGLSKG